MILYISIYLAVGFLLAVIYLPECQKHLISTITLIYSIVAWPILIFGGIMDLFK